MDFFLKDQEYIELNKLLKYFGLVESGAHAKEVIDAGKVLVNREIDLRRRRKCRSGDLIEFGGDTIHVK